MRDIVNNALSIARYMGSQYFHIAENVVIVHAPKNQYKTESESKLVIWTKIVICALFSFGVFRDEVYNQSFKTRINIYSSTILFWLIVAFIIATLVLLLNGSLAYTTLAFVACCLMSYAGFQMLNMEYKNISFSIYTRDTKGVWERSQRNEINAIQRKHLDFLMPFMSFIKHTRFLYNIYTCDNSIDSVKLDVYKFLDNSIKSSELLYVIKDRELYKITCEMIQNDSTKNVSIKNSTPADGDISIVAWTVLTALDMNADDLDWVKDSCADELSMYSWNKSIIVYVNGKPVGAIISYPGDSYDALRKHTWPKLWGDIDKETIDNTEVEAYPGEYYLDSMAILPEYRGYSIGKSLILAAIEQGISLGYDKFSLLVDCNKPKLKAYYEGIGFNEIGEMTFFGHRYKRMMKHDA